MFPFRPKYFLPLLSFGLITAASGCSQIDTGSISQSSLAGGDQQSIQSSQTGGDAQVCSVFVQAENRKPQQYQIDLHSTCLVQDALDKTGATKKFRRMQVVLYRKSPTTGRPHKLEITYSSGKRHVDELTNYALLPGDRLLVKEDTTTALDDIIGKALSPLGHALPH